MNFWDILGIEQTADLSVIKKAYADKSKQCHPEDDPEGFQRLRAAYRQAVAASKFLAEMAQQPPDDVFDVAAAEGADTPDSPPASGGALETPIEWNDESPEEDSAVPDQAQASVATDFSAADNCEMNYFIYSPLGTQAGIPEPPEKKRLLFRRSGAGPGKFRVGRLPIFLVLFVIVKILPYLFNAGGGDPSVDAIYGGYYESGYGDSYGGGYKSTIPAFHGTLTVEDVDTLKEQALVIVSQQKLNRSEIMECIADGIPYEECPAAASLKISVVNYKRLSEVYRNQGAKALYNELQKCRQPEVNLVVWVVVPRLKYAIVSAGYTKISQELGGMVGMTDEELLQICSRYQKDLNERLLDKELAPYNCLASPDNWT